MSTLDHEDFALKAIELKDEIDFALGDDPPHPLTFKNSYQELADLLEDRIDRIVYATGRIDICKTDQSRGKFVLAIKREYVECYDIYNFMTGCSKKSPLELKSAFFQSISDIEKTSLSFMPVEWVKACMVSRLMALLPTLDRLEEFLTTMRNRVKPHRRRIRHIQRRNCA